MTIRRTHLLFLSWFLISCSNGGSRPDVPGVMPGNTPGAPVAVVSELVHARSGGTVYLNDEVSLMVPPGSLAEDTTISIEKIDNPPAGDSDGLSGFGQAYRFLPAGTRFAQELPAIMALRYDGAAMAARGLDARSVQMYYFDEGSGRYVNVANQVDTTTNTLTSRVEHFTTYMPVAQAAILAGNPPPFIALQNSVPFPIRAGAPIYVRYSARDQDPANAAIGYTGGALAGVKLYYRKLQPMPGSFQSVDMVKEPVVNPVYAGTIEDTYGYRIPETFLTAADLGPGNDIEYCAQAIDNLGATNPALAGNPPCVPTGFDVTGVYQAGSLTVNAPTTTPITAGFSRTFRVRGSDAAGFFPLVPGPTAISVTNAVGTTTVSPSNATITFLGQKESTGVLTVFQGADSSSNTITVTNGQVASLEILDTNGMPITGTLPLAGQSSYAFDVRGLDGFGNVIDLGGVVWSAPASIGAIGASTGVLAVGNSAAVANVTATLGSLSATAPVNVIPRYRVSVAVTGLVGTTTLVNNGGDSITVSADGNYGFTTLLPDLAAFNVTASVQPTLGACHGEGGFISGANLVANVRCYQLRAGSVVGVPATNSLGATLAGQSSAGYVDATGGFARFDGPRGITTDGRYVYVADGANNVVRRVSLTTGAVTTLAGSGTAGSTDGVGPAARFQAVRFLTTDGTFVYVSDDTTVRKIRIATGAVTTVAGLAGASGSSDGAGAAARFVAPAGLVCDGPNLYVADRGAHVIRKIVLVTGAVTTIAGGAGAPGSIGGLGINARLNAPAGLSTDGAGLYVADSGNLSIRRVDLMTGQVTTVAGTGSFGHGDGPGLSASFLSPYDIATDGATLYVTDASGAAAYIRRVDLATFAVSTLAGGSASYVDGANSLFGNDSLGITSDGSKLIIADSTHDAVRTYYCTGDCSASLPALAITSCRSPGSCPIPTNVIPGFCQTIPFTHSFSASGGFPPYTWTSTNFPLSSTLNGASGVLTVPVAGPTLFLQPCTYDFQICVRDVLGTTRCDEVFFN